MCRSWLWIFIYLKIPTIFSCILGRNFMHLVLISWPKVSSASQFAILQSLSISSRVAHEISFHIPGKNASLIHLPLRHQNSLLAEIMLLVRSDVIAVTISRTVPRSRRPSKTRCFCINKLPHAERITLGFWESDPQKSFIMCFLFRFYYVRLVTSIFKIFLFKTVEWLKVQNIYGRIVSISVVVFKVKPSRRADIANVVIKEIRKRNV